METASTEVTSIWRRNDKEKSTWRTHRYFVDFESRIHVEISKSNRCHNFHVDSPFKIDVIFTNFPRGILTSNRWRIDEDVSIGKKSFTALLLCAAKSFTAYFLLCAVIVSFLFSLHISHHCSLHCIQYALNNDLRCTKLYLFTAKHSNCSKLLFGTNYQWAISNCWAVNKYLLHTKKVFMRSFITGLMNNLSTVLHMKNIVAH